MDKPGLFVPAHNERDPPTGVCEIYELNKNYVVRADQPVISGISIFGRIHSGCGFSTDVTECRNALSQIPSCVGVSVSSLRLAPPQEMLTGEQRWSMVYSADTQYDLASGNGKLITHDVCVLGGSPAGCCSAGRKEDVRINQPRPELQHNIRYKSAA